MYILREEKRNFSKNRKKNFFLPPEVVKNFTYLCPGRLVTSFVVVT